MSNDNYVNTYALRLVRARRIMLALNGAGGTIDAVTCAPITRGYAVGGNGKSITLSESATTSDTFTAFNVLLDRVETLALSGTRYAIGAWLTDDDDVCLDIVDIVASEQGADALARMRGEQAYGDLAAYARGEDGTRYV